MKLDIIIVNLAIVALVVVPYMLFIILGWGEARKFKNKFREETTRHLGKADEVHSWNRIMTGLDKNLQKLVLVQAIDQGFRVEVIDLKVMRSCEIKTEYSTGVIDRVPSTILKRIDLEFSNISGEKFYLNLFDQNTTYQQDFELRNANKLFASVNGCLSFRPVINSAA